MAQRKESLSDAKLGVTVAGANADEDGTLGTRSIHHLGQLLDEKIVRVNKTKRLNQRQQVFVRPIMKYRWQIVHHITIVKSRDFD